MKYRVLIRDTDIGDARTISAGNCVSKQQAIKGLVPKYTRAKVKVEAMVCDDYQIDIDPSFWWGI